MSSDLPSEWSEAALVELIEPLQSGSRPKGGVRQIEAGVPSVGGEHLTSRGTFDFANVKYVPEAFFDSMKRGRIETGDVLIVKDGATTGKVALVRDDFPFERAVVNEHVFICRPQDAVRPDYLFWFLYSMEGQRRILEHFQGSAQGGINQAFAVGTRIPLAPYADQGPLVALIDAAAAKAQSAAEYIATARSVLRRFRQAIVLAACSGRLTAEWREEHSSTLTADALVTELLEDGDKRRPRSKDALPPEPLADTPDSWIWTELRLIADLKGGVQKGAKLKADEQTREVPYLRVANVQRGWLDLSEIKTIVVPVSKIEGLRLEPGDVLFNEGGDRDKLGRGWVWEGQIPECIHQNHVFRARLRSAQLQPRFYSWFGNSLGARYFNDEGKQTVNLASLSMSKLGDLPVPVPPPDEQLEIVHRVDQLLARADDLNQRIEAASRRVDRSSHAVLAKAFRGDFALADGGGIPNKP